MAAKVLLISPYGEELASCFNEEDQVTWKLEPHLSEGYDWVVCYGCRRMIREPWLTTYKNRMINIHISYLPYNRGADPNFWSWFDDTPKGITVHEVDAGLDTGRVVDQMEVRFRAPEKHTLKTSYEALRKAVPPYFSIVWSSISNGYYRPVDQQDGFLRGNTTHKASDKTRWMEMLPKKWDTPVLDVARLRDFPEGNVWL